MFQRAFKIKSNTAIKGSDRKKWRELFEKAFPQLTSEEIAQLIPNKEVNVLKLFTHSGAVVSVLTVQKDPVLFDVDGILYPTVYTLWKYPDLLPTFTTWPDVVPKLCRGADLMLPGIVLPEGNTFGRWSFGNLQKGAACAVNLVNNKACIAVGITALSSEDMYMSAKRGKGVVVLHTYNDQLWASGAKSHPPALSPPFELRLGSSALASCTAEAVMEPEENDMATGPRDLELTEATLEKDLDINTLASLSVVDAENDVVVASEKQGIEAEFADGSLEVSLSNQDNPSPSQFDSADNLLMYCFLKACKTRAKKMELPLLTSTFYRTYLLACVPHGYNLDVRKTSYKKLSKFLSTMQEKGLIQVKELSKGVESISEVNFQHPDLKSFVIDKDDVTPPATEQGETAPAREPPQIEELFLVSAAVLPLFKIYKHEKGSPLTSKDVRQILSNYVKDNNLQNAQQKNFISLDPVLSSILLKQTMKDVLDLKWDDAHSRLLKNMSPGYRVTIAGQDPIVRKGKLEPIELTVATRAANKKVTLVNNLETYGIDPHELAHAVQIGVAASTSVNPAPNKKEGQQVLIQGNQISFLAISLLEDYKIPRKYIKGLELAPKKGRK